MWGLVDLAPVGWYDPWWILDDLEREQVLFWQQCLPGLDVPDGKLAIFTIEGSAALPRLAQEGVSARRRHGLAFELEAGELDRVKRPLGVLSSDLLHACSNMCIRTGAAFACLAVQGSLGKLLLPDVALPDECLRNAFVIDWAALGFDDGELLLARHVRSSGEEAPLLDAACARRIADLVRQHVPLSAAAKTHVDALEEYARQLSPTTIASVSKAAQGKFASLQREGRSALPWKAAYLVHCVCMCDCLSDDRRLAEALDTALRMALPPAIAKVLIDALSGASEQIVVPDKTQVSRYRFAMDAAYMLCRRTMHQSGGDQIHYVLMDARGTRDLENEVIFSMSLYVGSVVRL